MYLIDGNPSGCSDFLVSNSYKFILFKIVFINVLFPIPSASLSNVIFFKLFSKTISFYVKFLLKVKFHFIKSKY